MGATHTQLVAKTVKALMLNEASVATLYLDPRYVIRAKRVLFRGRIQRGPDANVVLSFGRPNYQARQFIKACLKAGERFPVKKIQLKFPPKKRKAKAKRRTRR